MSDTRKPAIYVGVAGDAPRTPPARVALAAIERVDLGRAERRRIDRQGTAVALGLVDARMSTQHARLSRRNDAWVLEDLESKNGTWIGADRVTRRPLADGDAFVVGHTAIVFRADAADVGDLDGMPEPAIPGLSTMSAELGVRLRTLAAAAAPTAATIEITGEPGTAKDTVADAVHALSGRRGSFIPVGCAALSENDLDVVGEAAGGTLFLDDVVELPAGAQTALLAALAQHPDVRLVTATHRDLDGEVAAGRFRADLRERLRGTPFALSPLRRRREDLGMQVAMVLERLAPDRPVTLASDVVTALYAHDWPLNERELERSLETALAAAGDHVETQHLPAAVGSTEPMQQNTFRTMTSDEKVLRDRLVATIAKHRGNLAGVARELGKDRTQIRRWMKRFGITRDVS